MKNKMGVTDMTMLRRAVFLMALFFAAPAWAVQKCTAPDGKISYQDVECVDGKGGTLKITDNKSDNAPSGSNRNYSGGANTGPSHSASERVRLGHVSDPAIHTGPRGGRFHFTESGSKSYVRKGIR